MHSGLSFQESDNSASKARYQIASVATYLGMGVCVLLSLALRASNGYDWISSLLIVGIIALYAFYGWYWERDNARFLEKYAESTYFVGYLATIAGLVVVASQIQGLHELQGDQLIKTLVKGSIALFSTVVGLSGMFLLRVRVQSLDAVVGEAESDRGQSYFLEVAKSMAAEMEASVATFRTRVDEMSISVAQFYSQINSKQAESIDALTSRIQDLQTSFASGIQQTQFFVDTTKVYQAQIAGILTAVGQQAEELAAVSEPVREFVGAAREMSPELNRISANLHEVAPLADAVKQLLSSVQTLNEALTGSASTMAEISGNSRKMITSTGDLVEQVHTQVHKLQNVTKPLTEFSEKIQLLVPKLNGLGQVVSGMEDFSTTVQGLDKALDEFRSAVASSASEMRDVSMVVADFVETTRKNIVDPGENLASCKTD